jgi:hypothetical protein
MAHLTSFNAMDAVRKTHAGTITIRVTGMKQLRIRMWLTLALVRLAAWVCPAQLDIKTE